MLCVDYRALQVSPEVLCCVWTIGPCKCLLRYCVVLCVDYRALQVPPEAWLRFSHGHCGVTRVDIRPNGRVVVKSFGDTGHLPPPMLTFS